MFWTWKPTGGDVASSDDGEPAGTAGARSGTTQKTTEKMVVGRQGYLNLILI